jgi:hypothetical protein
MKKVFIFLMLSFLVSWSSQAQQLRSFSLSMQPSEDAYLSIKNKKAFSATDAVPLKQDIDLGLLFIKEDAGARIEWYNMSGKDDRIPADLKGTITRINAISFDRQQFDKCKTKQDLQRMTGHLTEHSYSHFAVLADGMTCSVTNHCFIVRMENGKKALLWVEGSVGCSYKVIVKSEQ